MTIEKNTPLQSEKEIKSNDPEEGINEDPLGIELDRQRVKLWYRSRLKMNVFYPIKHLAANLNIGEENLPKILMEYSEIEKRGVLEFSTDKKYFRIIKERKPKKVASIGVENKETETINPKLLVLYNMLKENYNDGEIPLENIELKKGAGGRNPYTQVGGRKKGLILLAKKCMAKETEEGSGLYNLL